MIIFLIFMSLNVFAASNKSSVDCIEVKTQNIMQWGLKKLNVPKIEYNKKIESSVVAIIDTGIDVNHESLKNSLWENPGEVGIDAKGNKKQNNGIDDDRNGHIDDVHGWNFVNNNNNLKDTNGHGTHIAGIIVGRTPCGMVFGVAPNTKIMVLKYFSSQQSGEQTLNKSIAAMNYAVAMGAQIINYSGGGLSPHIKEEQILNEAYEKGILLVAAAGNEQSFADKKPYYPASYNLKNILSVAAIDEKNQLAEFSNYGKKNVDIAGPGVKIWSSLPGNKYGYLSGTSQATAYLTGVAALLLQQNPGLHDPEQVIQRIQISRKKVQKLEEKTQFSGIANTQKSLSLQAETNSLNGGFTQHHGIMKNWFLLNSKDSILNFK